MQAHLLRGRPAWLLALGLAGAPALAGPADGALTVGLEFWIAAPRDNELDFAFINSGTGIGGDLLTLSGRRDAAPRLRAGWRFGSAHRAEARLTIQEYDAAAHQAVAPLAADEIGALLTSPGLPIQPNVDAVAAMVRTRAARVDLELRWRLEQGPDTRLEWFAGVRALRYEGRSVVTYTDEEIDFFGSQLDTSAFVNSEDDTRGFGPHIGLDVTRRMAGRMWFGAAATVALPAGKIEALTTETVLVDDDGPGGQAPDLAGVTVVRRPGTRRSFPQLEAELRLEARLGRGWTAAAILRVERWSGIGLRPRLADAQNVNLALFDEVDVAFEGIALGVGYEF